jgi:hypothetical protein
VPGAQVPVAIREAGLPADGAGLQDQASARKGWLLGRTAAAQAALYALAHLPSVGAARAPVGTGWLGGHVSRSWCSGAKDSSAIGSPAEELRGAHAIYSGVSAVDWRGISPGGRPRVSADIAIRRIASILCDEAEVAELPADLRATLLSVGDGTEPDS